MSASACTLDDAIQLVGRLPPRERVEFIRCVQPLVLAADIDLTAAIVAGIEPHRVLATRTPEQRLATIARLTKGNRCMTPIWRAAGGSGHDVVHAEAVYGGAAGTVTA